VNHLLFPPLSLPLSPISIPHPPRSFRIKHQQGSGLKGAVNLTGKGGNSMAKHMNAFSSSEATPRSKKSPFSRKKSGEAEASP